MDINKYFEKQNNIKLLRHVSNSRTNNNVHGVTHIKMTFHTMESLQTLNSLQIIFPLYN